MTLYGFFIFLLFVEGFLFIVVFALILIKRYLFYFNNKKHGKIKREIAIFLMNSISHPEKALPEDLPKRLRIFEDLLVELEVFEHRFQDAAWEILKIKMATYYLVAKAEKMASSFFWIKRQLAARCFSIAPQKKNEKIILHLLADPIFLVRASAAEAALRIESKKTILALIRKMGLSSGYERSFYRDILLRGSREVLVFIEEIAKEEKNELVHIAALEVLANKTSSFTLAEIKKDLVSKNQQIRLLALKLISRNPRKGFEKVLLKHLQSKSPEERAEAAQGLGNFLSETTLDALAKTLQEETWKIRLQSARSLKSLGERGIEILKKQELKKNKNAYEAAQYVLQFS